MSRSMFTIAWFAVFVLSSSLRADPPQHLTLGLDYIQNVTPETNVYGDDATITENNGVIEANTKCGSFTALLYKHAYSYINNSELQGLFGSSSPLAEQWYNGFVQQNFIFRKWGILQAKRIGAFSDVLPGDVLASAYEHSNSSGHVMTAWGAAPSGLTEIDGIPGYEGPNAVREWYVLVIDSTQSPHNIWDSRMQDEDDDHNEGIGWGFLFIYTDPVDDHIVGWTWSLASSTPYQCTAPEQTETYRPLVAGRIQSHYYVKQFLAP